MSDVDSAQWSDGGHEWGITADSLVIYQKRETEKGRKVPYLSYLTFPYSIALTKSQTYMFQLHPLRSGISRLAVYIAAGPMSRSLHSGRSNVSIPIIVIIY